MRVGRPRKLGRASTVLPGRGTPTRPHVCPGNVSQTRRFSVGSRWNWSMGSRCPSGLKAIPKPRRVGDLRPWSSVNSSGTSSSTGIRFLKASKRYLFGRSRLPATMTRVPPASETKDSSSDQAAWSSASGPASPTMTKSESARAERSSGSSPSGTSSRLEKNGSLRMPKNGCEKTTWSTSTRSSRVNALSMNRNSQRASPSISNTRATSSTTLTSSSFWLLSSRISSGCGSARMTSRCRPSREAVHSKVTSCESPVGVIVWTVASWGASAGNRDTATGRLRNPPVRIVAVSLSVSSPKTVPGASTAPMARSLGNRVDPIGTV